MRGTERYGRRVEKEGGDELELTLKAMGPEKDCHTFTPQQRAKERT